jgi:GT2 family glycosyltransferase
MPSASVVIPTFNRRRALERVLEALQLQRTKVTRSCQVVVVDDGSDDGTGEWLDTRASDLGVTVVHQPNAGPAKARNRGVQTATGEVVLFLGDDTVPQPGWLLEHLESQRIVGPEPPTAVVGYTSFPAGDNSPFLRWINEFGAQFGYSIIDDPSNVPFNFFYTSNVSLPREVLRRHDGFREDFPAAAWEDIEFAYRAVATGMRLRYQPRARTVHHHRVGVASFAARQRTSGRSAAIFADLHPELEDFLGIGCVRPPSVLDRARRFALRAWIEGGEILHSSTPHGVYRQYFDGWYLDGLRQGMKGDRIGS